MYLGRKILRRKYKGQQKDKINKAGMAIQVNKFGNKTGTVCGWYCKSSEREKKAIFKRLFGNLID